MKVLFDFEISRKPDDPRDANHIIHKMIREFFISRYRVVEDEVDSYQKESDFAAIIISIGPEVLRTIPHNIPAHLLTKVNSCITKRDFNYLQDKLISMKRSL